jgi:DNA polymerase-1
LITLLDLGAEFWRNYFAARLSAAEAYSMTIDRFEWYFRDCPRTVLCCEGRGLKRRDWFPDYKGNRPPKPEEAIESLVAVGQQVASWGVPVLACDGYEADDIIATLVKQAWIDDVQILSADKDLFQLLAPNVKIIGKGGLIGEPECVAKFGVKPSQMRDWLALVGDQADNIPGCPNCGPGRARDLLQRFGSIETIKQTPAEKLLEVRGVGEKTVASIREWDPAMAVRLVTLLDDAPVELESLWSSAA